MIKIIIVEDQDLVRAAIIRLLAEHSDLQIVAEAPSAEAALALIAEHKPDLIFMDLSLPGMSGLQAIAKINSLHPALKIIVLSGHSHEPQLTTALQAGAKGYLSKGASPDKMLQAIRTVLSGKLYLEPILAQALALAQSNHGTKNPLSTLSSRERAVFEQVIQGVEAELIATQLGINVKTVNTYRYRLYDKLQVENDVQLTRLAMRYGLLGQQPEEPE